jgi:hypothetical protein
MRIFALSSWHKNRGGRGFLCLLFLFLSCYAQDAESGRFIIFGYGDKPTDTYKIYGKSATIKDDVAYVNKVMIKLDYNDGHYVISSPHAVYFDSVIKGNNGLKAVSKDFDITGKNFEINLDKKTIIIRKNVRCNLYNTSRLKLR